MRCDRCEAEAPVLKTVRWRTGERRFVLCAPCWEPVAGAVWIVPGPTPAHGFCTGCSYWFPVGELVRLRSGWKWDAPSGLCHNCRKDMVDALVGEDV